MEANNITEVVQKLVGSIKPAGESHLDNQRFENLKVMCSVIDSLISEVRFTARDKDRYEASMKEMGQYAQNFLTVDLGIVE